MSVPHRIRRQAWRVRAGSASDAFALRERLRVIGGSLLEEGVGPVFDAFAAPDRVVRLARLEVTVRVPPGAELADALPGVLGAAVHERLVELLGPPPVRSGGSAGDGRPAGGAGEGARRAPVGERGVLATRARRTGGGGEAGPLGSVVPMAEPEGGGADLRTRSGDRHRGRQRAGSAQRPDVEPLLHYLRSGVVPWTIAQQPAGEIVALLRSVARERVGALMRAATREAVPTAFLLRLLTLLLDERAAIPDVVAALGRGASAGWGEVLPALLLREPPFGGSDWPAWKRIPLAVTLLAAGPGMAPTGAAAGTAAALRALAAALPDVEVAELARSAASAVAATGVGVGAADSDADPDGAAAGKRPDGTRRRDRGPSGAAAPVPADAPRAGAATPPDGTSRSGMPPDAGGSSGPGDVPPVTAVAGESTQAEPAFGLASRSVGLVLLHPFLATLFHERGITREAHGPGIPRPALPRAAALLHFLATGSAEPMEFELPLVKVLLGLAPEEPLVPLPGLLDAADREEAAALLAAVVGHWTALKRTSPDGLRAAFLTRSGLLYRESPGWLLRVEGATHDRLLDFLPWSFSLVRLPWMPEPLRTEWTPP